MSLIERYAMARIALQIQQEEREILRRDYLINQAKIKRERKGWVSKGVPYGRIKVVMIDGKKYYYHATRGWRFAG